jgi:magnesium transporter
MKHVFKRSQTAGLSPGTLVHVGEKMIGEPRLRLFHYTKDRSVEKDLQHIEEAFSFPEQGAVTWINIDGLHRVDILETIGRKYDIHPLVLEDILNTAQRPKMEAHPKFLFTVIKMMEIDERTQDIQIEQMSIILAENLVISFQEAEGDIFDSLRARIRNNDSRLRAHGSDYLFYRLMDIVVDNYFVILERLGEKIEDLESRLLGNPSREVLHEIHKLKRELIFVRRSVWPLREVISGLQRHETSMIRDETKLYLRDIYDHTIQVIDTMESYRDMVSGMIDIYLSSQGNKMNEVMKTLTIMASIFIPLTFIAGIYGMNFSPDAGPLNMPELNWSFGYPAALAVMGAIAGGLVVFFKRKKWF